MYIGTDVLRESEGRSLVFIIDRFALCAEFEIDQVTGCSVKVNVAPCSNFVGV